MSPDDYAVEVHRLVKRYGRTTALDGIDLEVPTGTVTAVLGPNGAGKTTAVRILTTLSEADEGRATVAGFDVRTEPTTSSSSTGAASSPGATPASSSGRWNPATTLSDAVRIQFANLNPPASPGDPWPIAHPLAYSLIWIVGIVVVCAPLAVRAYQRSIQK